MQQPTGEAPSGSRSLEVPSSTSATASHRRSSPTPLLPTSSGPGATLPLPPLPDDIIAEILIRLPQDDPSCLLRALLTCKGWLRIVSDPDFRRRLGLFHPTPPMLGFIPFDHFIPFVQTTGGFIATTVSPFSLPNSLPRPRAMDCRHGRALFFDGHDTIIVWEPMTGVRWDVHVPLVDHFFTPSMAVVCAVNSCDHSCCSGGPFLVVFSTSKGEDLLVFVYSSETGAWVETALIPGISRVFGNVLQRPSVLVGQAIYFLHNHGVRYILECGLDGSYVALVKIPDGMHTHDEGLLLMPAEDGGLGFAGLVESSLSLWSLKEDGHGVSDDSRWLCHRVIGLSNLLPEGQVMNLLGFAEGINAIFIGIDDDIFTVELKPERSRRVCAMENIRGLLPLLSFYTPENAAAIGLREAKESSSVDSMKLCDAVPSEISMVLGQDADSSELKNQKEELCTNTMEVPHGKVRAAEQFEFQGASSIDMMTAVALHEHPADNHKHQKEESDAGSLEMTKEKKIAIADEGQESPRAAKTLAKGEDRQSSSGSARSNQVVSSLDMVVTDRSISALGILVDDNKLLNVNASGCIW
ncbi:hypothetical protein EJB05_39744 [Eragrostis curvula]|uniref:Uncharacterized protein n=1 Tax=Eragrostis curvula TaxID=38414 RepID=A0A5J9TXR3_9POAL|nr:hypothetical protein EJB05_39744 [Eragrostis curvula]